MNSVNPIGNVMISCKGLCTVGDYVIYYNDIKHFICIYSVNYIMFIIFYFNLF